jgi:hypothetical protein
MPNLAEIIAFEVDRQLKAVLGRIQIPVTAQQNGATTSDGHRTLNFQGAGVVVRDDPTNRRTNIFISGGASQSSPTYVYSAPGSKALSLWNGSSNNAPPANWQTTGFNDSTWVASVTPSGYTGYNMAPNFGPANSVWPEVSAPNAAELVLVRHHFTLPSGTISSATIRILVDSKLTALYMNGTLIGSAPDTAWPQPTPPNFFDFDVPISALVAGGSNVIAIEGQNNLVTSVAGGIIYRLTANYGVATPLSVATWTQVNMTNGSATDVPTGIALRGNPSSGNDTKILVRPTPATPYTVTAGFTPGLYPANFSAAGMCLRDSASGKLVEFLLRISTGALQLAILDYTDPFTFSVTELTISGAQFGSGTVWLQIQDDGTNVSFLSSVDGANWSNLLTRTRTTFLTANQIGICVNSATSNQPVSMTLTSWSGA